MTGQAEGKVSSSSGKQGEAGADGYSYPAPIAERLSGQGEYLKVVNVHAHNNPSTTTGGEEETFGFDEDE